MLVSFDVNNEHQSVVVLNLLHGGLSGQGELDDGIMVEPGRMKEMSNSCKLCTVFML